MIDTVEALAREVLATFEARKLKLATVESCTGGLVIAALTEIPGSSSVVERGFITYSNEAKSELVGVDPALIEAHGAVSEEVAMAMAQGGLGHSQADIVVAVTGIAGPGGSDFKPEGRVCFAAASRSASDVETKEFGPLGRSVVRRRSVEASLRQALAISART